MTTLMDITEAPPRDEQLAPLDRRGAVAANAQQADWIRDGYLVLERFMPDKLIDAYCEAWEAANDVQTGKSCWPACAYMHSEAVLDLCLYGPLVEALRPLVGGSVGLHLCLTGWRSTTRDWHQDDYLNPSFVNSWYAAAWIALADIHPASGPFEVIPGSHRWRRLRRELVLPAFGLDQSDPDWPSKTEEKLTPLVQAALQARGLAPKRMLLKRGDVLIWHGCIYHRGTLPSDPHAERRACIAHYSAMHKRTDMKPWRPHGSGFYYEHFQPLSNGRYAP